MCSLQLDSTQIQPLAVTLAPWPQTTRHGSQSLASQLEVTVLARNYPDPWVPRTFQAWVVKQSRVERVTDRVSGEIRRRNVDCWDVKGKADGVQWFKRFHKAGLAETWRERAERDFSRGLPFDLRSKQFVEAAVPNGPEMPSVFELTELYFRQHPEWEPNTKTGAARSFNRARRWLLVPGAEPSADELAAAEDYLDHASFLPVHLLGRITDRQRAGQRWLETHSTPADSITSNQIEEFVTRFELNQRNPDKRVSAATLTRYLQPLKACWTWAVSLDDVQIDRNPWVVVRPRRKVKGKTTLTTGRGGLAVDADMVLDVPQSLALAEACATDGNWGGVVECFVLVMALCGLRPGEAAGLLSEDIELPVGTEPGWLVVRRNHRPTQDRWLDADEDPEWGPLKDRDLAESRRVPVPSLLVAKLRQHGELYGEGPGGMVFHRNNKAFDRDMFARSVWEPARSKLFPRRANLAPDDPRQPKLSRLRRHDLRHAACSWWLREGVDAVVCQRWSGHRTLSVFLDIYQGVAPGREDEGVQRLERGLPPAA
jgi:integrase